ncbi:MAG: hypothetical protein NC918_06070 [Candidatus Omnitrophica bacterium]|nr:hypothetical protein [Candidatus Omnitrophota bacterium]
MLIKLKSQSTAEYAILLSIVIAAALSMQNEIRKVLQARYHDAANYFVSNTQELGTTYQYEPSSGTKVTTNQKSSKRRDEYFDDEAQNDVTARIIEDSSLSYESTRVE